MKAYLTVVLKYSAWVNILIFTIWIFVMKMWRSRRLVCWGYAESWVNTTLKCFRKKRKKVCNQMGAVWFSVKEGLENNQLSKRCWWDGWGKEGGQDWRKVRGDRVKRAGGLAVGGNHWERVVKRRWGERDEEVDIGQVVSTGKWENEERMSSIFFYRVSQ